jgi:hypothetical protein
MRTNRNEKIHLFCRLVVITNNKNQIRPVVHIVVLLPSRTDSPSHSDRSFLKCRRVVDQSSRASFHGLDGMTEFSKKFHFAAVIRCIPRHFFCLSCVCFHLFIFLFDNTRRSHIHFTRRHVCVSLRSSL